MTDGRAIAIDLDALGDTRALWSDWLASARAVLGALLVRATGRSGLAFALGTLYAAGDEIHQTFVPGRMGSPIDVAIDAIGVACGVVLWQTIRTHRLA